MTDADAVPDVSLLSEIEGLATEIARGGGAILARYFGTEIATEYKDEERTDPVTTADRECQQYLVEAISSRFPDHGIVGEEDKEGADAVAPDTVWILDPLDGTKNFVNGLPVFACSVGVVHRGAPVVGAIYLPWPFEANGVVLHARAGGGAYQGERRLQIPEADLPAGNRLMGLPGSFGFRFRPELRGKAGDRRVTGSIAFELAMTARGSLQYSLFGAPHLWDIAAGVVLVAEAGGAVMVGSRRPGAAPLMPPRLSWTPGNLLPDWKPGKTTLGDLRRWSAPLAAGSPGIVRHVTRNLALRSSLRRRVRQALRGRRSGSGR